MRRVLVTGGSGFIGSHLTEALLVRGDEVTVVDDESTGSATNLAEIRSHERLTYVQASIGDPELVEGLTQDVDEVYHLAAAVGVALVASKPLETIERNIYPTELLLASLRGRVERGETVKCFLASTSEVYGKNPKDTWSEDDDIVLGPTTKPRWSYAASKAIDEFLALATWREYGLPVVIGRFFNVVGPRQTGTYGMVLPRFVDAALANEPLIVHDDGQQTRCFAHVHDVVAAVLQLMDSEQAVGQVLNIGSDRPISIIDLARRVIELSGSSSEIRLQSYAEAYDEDFEDIRLRVPDLSRLKSIIPYDSTRDLDDIISQVIESRREASR